MRREKILNTKLIIVRGGGDIASGTIEKLHNCGFNVLVTEVEFPTSIEEKSVMEKPFMREK